MPSRNIRLNDADPLDGVHVARVSVPASIYVNVPYREGDDDAAIFARAADILNEADGPCFDGYIRADSPYLNDCHDAITYVTRDEKGDIPLASMGIQDEVAIADLPGAEVVAFVMKHLVLKVGS